MTIMLFIIITNKLKKSIIAALFYARNHKIVDLAQYRLKILGIFIIVLPLK